MEYLVSKETHPCLTLVDPVGRSFDLLTSHGYTHEYANDMGNSCEICHIPAFFLNSTVILDQRYAPERKSYFVFMTMINKTSISLY